MGDFIKVVVEPVRRLLGRSVDVPSGFEWTVAEDGGGIELGLIANAEKLAGNMQDPTAAAPTYLLCFAYWLQRQVEQPVRCAVRIKAPNGALDEPHFNRTLFLLNEYHALLGDVFRWSCEDERCWRWPDQPVFNEPRASREDDGRPHRPEATLEIFLCSSDAPWAAFSENVGPVHRFRRQLPVGLFSGTVSEGTRHTPGSKSGIDMWTTSAEGDVFHLFELKDQRNQPLGIIPEVFYYARLLDYVRNGISGRAVEVTASADGLAAVKKARKTVAWLVAGKFHPLVHSMDDSPLAMFNHALTGKGLEFRILPYQGEAHDGSFRWRFSETWPRPRQGA